VLQEYVLQEYVLQEYVFENPTIFEREVLCAAKDETSVEIMGRKLCRNFLRKSRL
jgi:hypothetical protein